MNFTLHVWRQRNAEVAGRMVTYTTTGVSPDMSFLEMLDALNEQLVSRGEEAIAFDSDCREGICGTCSLMIDGVAHGPLGGTTVCQLHMPTSAMGSRSRSNRGGPGPFASYAISWSTVVRSTASSRRAASCP